jgi:predicted  nucleic acid-binding Zn-ribbon protein
MGIVRPGTRRGNSWGLVRKTGRESLFGLAVNNSEQKTRLQREIEATDRQIDQLVYELYGLTEEETKIVEGIPS